MFTVKTIDILFVDCFVAVGCPDIVPPKWSRMKRIDNQCEIDCPENPSHKWVLECINNQWVGEVGKCPPLFLGEIATTDKPKSSGFWSFVTSLPLSMLHVQHCNILLFTWLSADCHRHGTFVKIGK